MRKTTSYSSSSSDALSIDTAGLQKMLNSGRQTATQIGMAAGAKFCVGRRVYWNVAKIRKYLDEIDNVLKRLRQQGIEIERFTHHAFRDTFATRYIEEGGNMQTLQKILGHSSLAMTADLYAHVLPNTKQQEMQQIENGFIGVAVL